MAGKRNLGTHDFMDFCANSKTKMQFDTELAVSLCSASYTK